MYEVFNQHPLIACVVNMHFFLFYVLLRIDDMYTHVNVQIREEEEKKPEECYYSSIDSLIFPIINRTLFSLTSILNEQEKYLLDRFEIKLEFYDNVGCLFDE